MSLTPDGDGTHIPSLKTRHLKVLTYGNVMRKAVNARQWKQVAWGGCREPSPKEGCPHLEHWAGQTIPSAVWIRPWGHYCGISGLEQKFPNFWRWGPLCNEKSEVSQCRIFSSTDWEDSQNIWHIIIACKNEFCDTCHICCCEYEIECEAASPIVSWARWPSQEVMTKDPVYWEKKHEHKCYGGHTGRHPTQVWKTSPKMWQLSQD